MKVIVVGCGRVGRDLTLALVQAGHSVTVVDSDSAAFDSLGPRFSGRTITGVPFDRDVLLQAGIERVDGLAAVTSSDNANIITARIARIIYHVPQVVARLYEPKRADVYRRLGLQTISSTTWGVNRIMQLLTHTRLHPMYEMGSGEVAMMEVEIGPALDGRTVADLNSTAEIKVVAITRSGKAFIPTDQARLMAGDLVHIAAGTSGRARLENLVGW